MLYLLFSNVDMHVSPVWEVAVFAIMWGLKLEQSETAWPCIYDQKHLGPDM